MQAQFQPLFLVVDVANSRDSSLDLSTFWIILYLSILLNIAFLKPIITSLYERDPDDPCWKSGVWITI
jgi:hypothetical protein